MGLLDPPALSPLVAENTYASQQFVKRTRPTGLGWDPTVLDFDVYTCRQYGNAGVAAMVSVTPEQAFNARSTALTAPYQTFYCSTSGSDNSPRTGLTEADAWFSISKAVQAANATGQPCKIMVKGGTPGSAASLYERVRSLTYNAGPSVDIAFVAYGGRVMTGPFDLTGTTAPAAAVADATYTNCYSWAVTNVNKVVDIADRNRYGNYVELRSVATAALCNATPNSWALVSGTLYVNRADKAAVTNANTRVYRTGSAFAMTSHANIYLGGATSTDGFDLEGGSSSSFDVAMSAATTATKIIAVTDCSFKYAGSFTNQARAIYLEGFGGVAYFNRCQADAAQSDGFNAHNVIGSQKCHMLTVNCTGYDNGRAPNNSCNGWTSHDNCVAIDVAGHYRGNHGGSVASVDNTKSWIIGTHIEDDRGDLHFNASNTLPPTAVYVRDNAEYWCEEVKVDMPASTRAYATLSATSKIHRRNCQPVRQRDVTMGTIDAY